jgi:hypothetical protein
MDSATERVQTGRRTRLKKRRWFWPALIVAVASILWAGKPAVACSHFNPLCWVEEAFDIIKDLLQGAAMLVLDIIELDPEEFFDDLTDIAEDFIFCDGLGIPEVNYVEFLILMEGAKIAEHLFDDCDSSAAIEPEVLTKLATYFRSDLSSVRIHRDCDFDVSGRLAITFGENIYFKSGEYSPTCVGPDSCFCRGGFDPEGFAILVHELIHTMQYRREGFKDFICMYSLECGLGGLIDLECGFEQQAFVYQALVLEDMRRDGDGIFTCPLGECDDDVHEWNYGNVGFHSCVAEVQLCGASAGDPSAPDYCEFNDNCPDVFNPDQADSDGDGRGDACDFCNAAIPPFEDIDDDCVADVSDNCACSPADVALLQDCDPTNDLTAPSLPGACFPRTGCAAMANPGQEDFDADGAGDVCDLDDDNDQLSDVDEGTLGTNPFDVDTDDDVLWDGCEVHGSNPTDPLDADSDDDGLNDGAEDANQNCAQDAGETDPNDPDSDDDELNDGVEEDNGTDPLDSDSDDDGIIDGEDVEFLQNAISDLPPDAFLSDAPGLRTAMLRILEGVEARTARGQIGKAISELRNLRKRVDGCGLVADVNDWVVDCAAQVQIRMLLDLLIENLETTAAGARLRTDLRLSGWLDR